MRSITEDKNGNLWFNTVGGGISRLDKDRKFFTNYTTAQGLANNNSWPMLKITMTISGSALKWDYPVLMENLSQTIPQLMECRTMKSEDMVMDKDGVIWLGTNKGTYCS